jgi:hypothetical protein
METITPMFSSALPSNPGKLLHSCSVHRSTEGELTLSLYDKCLIETTSKTRQVMLFDFDLKYGFTLSPHTINFEKQ